MTVEHHRRVSEVAKADALLAEMEERLVRLQKDPRSALYRLAATTVLEVTGGDVRLVQEVLGHANLNTLQGYTKIVDSRKQEAYRLYQEFLDQKKKA